MAKKLTIPRDLIRRLTTAAECTHLNDGELLERFVNRDEGTAFRELVERHGALVYGVCLRILRSNADAEDACQATFLVLARKASGIRKKTSLACWLHGVARRVSMTALRRNLDRRKHEQARAVATAALPEAERSWSEVQALLDRELESLPDRYRSPIILCYLEGKTRDEAARILRISTGKLHGLLERGRVLLHVRLEKQGIGFEAAMLGTILSGGICQALPANLATQTVSTALAGAPAACDTVTILSHEVLKIMFHSKLKALAAGFGITVAVIGGGFVAAGMVESGDKSPPAPMPKAVAVAQVPKKAETPPPFRGILKGHKGSVASVSVSTDAKLVVSGSYDGTVKAWSAINGKEQVAIEAFESCVGSVAIHPNGKFVAATCAGSPGPGKDLTKIKVWDLSTGERKMMLEGHKTMGVIVSYSPDGKVLASGGIDEIKFWDANSGKELQTLKGHDGWINSLVFNADGKLLASKCNGGLIKIWDTTSGKELAAHKDDSSFGHMAFSPDGKSIATVVEDNRLVVYDLFESKFVERLSITAGKKGERIFAIVFSPDGKTLATGGDGDSILLWNAADGKQKKLFQGHKEAVQSLAFSPDGKTLISGGQDATVQLWNATGD